MDDLTENYDGSFRANHCANPASCAFFGHQFCRVISLGCDPLGRQPHHLLRTGANTQFTALAICFVYNDSTLQGHSTLLVVFPRMPLLSALIPDYPHYAAVV